MDLAKVIASHIRPITFVFGAGASLSSGAPSTPTVHKRFAEVTKGRFRGRVREHFHELTRPEVREHLQPLFAKVVPDVGYRLLASLARTRRIYVLALNWDDAVKKACDAVDVPVAWFDPLREGSLEEKEGELPPDRGVLVVHVHGTLADDVRYGFLETLPDQPRIWEAVAPLLRHETIICGASLTGDLDVAHVMQRLSHSDRDDTATWLYIRPSGLEPPVPIPAAWEQVESEQADFDDLMIILAEEILGAGGQSLTHWDDLVKEMPYLNLRQTEDLVELKPLVRRQALAARVAGLVAPPFSGKSVGAVRLGHLRRLIDGVEQPLRVSVEAQDSPAELAISVARGDVVVVVDDPFGSDGPQTNPRVRDFLLTLCEADNGYAAVSSPIANWEAEAGKLLDVPAGLYIPPTHAGEWYERDRLARFAARRSHKRPALSRVHAGILETPPEVLEVGRTGQPVDTRRLVDDKRRLLDNDPILGLLCAMVRLQERAGAPISSAELTAILGCDPGDVKRSDGLLSPQKLGRTSFLTFNHPTSGVAAAHYLAEHFDEIRARLEEAKVLPAWIDRCLLGWALASGRSLEVAEDLDPEDEPEPADWMAQRLGSHPDESVLASMQLEPRDEWATIDFAYEIVRVWDSIKGLPRGKCILDELINRPMGLYGLLEGCLYFGAEGNDQLWTRLMGKLYELPQQSSRSFEMLLILDAVMWRAPNHEPLQNWASDTIEGLSPTCSEFAIVRFAAGYHPAGLAMLDIKRALAKDSKHAWTSEQAAIGAKLVAWHFAHQSRARVLLHRRTDIDKEWLCQGLGQVEPKEEVELAPQLRLIGSLTEFPETAGWGFHLACNLAVVAGLDLYEESVQATAREALEAAPVGDPGVTAAVVAYRSADMFSRDLRTRFEGEAEFDRILNAMGSGLEVADGLVVAPPRFRFVDDPIAVYRTLGQSFPTMDPELPLEPVELAAGLWRAAAGILEGRTRQVRRHVSTLIERVRRGDLRPVLSQTRLEKPTGEAFADAVLRMLQDWDSDKERLF
jgi:hypothetical protein